MKRNLLFLSLLMVTSSARFSQKTEMNQPDYKIPMVDDRWAVINDNVEFIEYGGD